MRFQITVARGAAELTVEVAVPPGSTSFTLGDDAGPYVTDLTVAGLVDPSPRPLVLRGDAVEAPSCASGCRLRYQLALGRAARELAERKAALRVGEVAVMSPPSFWLLRPEGAPTVPFTAQVNVAPGERFVTGVRGDTPGAAGQGGHFEGVLGTLDDAPLAMLGDFALRNVTVGKALLQVATALPSPSKPRAMDLEKTAAWVEDGARHLEAYLGGTFPVAHTLVVVMPVPGRRVGSGFTLGGGGASVLLSVGDDVSLAIAKEDWVLTHELVHVVTPTVGWPHAWMEEGLATYLEPLVRARRGVVSEATFWRDLMEGVPQGLPRAGDEGLNRTPTWGRTYWGGALFWLVVDVEIRARTGNRRSLDDVLRTFAAEGHTGEEPWTVEELLARGDAATGVPVLTESYASMAKAPGEPDLPALWKRLGLTLRREGRGAVVFDESAPLAAARRSIAGPRR